MKVLVTGSTGFLGFAIVRDLVAAGHQVTGLARSRESADRLGSVGAKYVLGDIEDLAVIREAAKRADGIIHTAFYHKISHLPLGTRLKVMMGGLPSGIVGRFMKASIDADRNALETMGAILAKSGGPLVAAFPTMSLQPGVVATEDDMPGTTNSPGALRGITESVMRRLAPQVRTSVVRLPPIVHGEGDKNGLLPQLIKTARKKGESWYIGDGSNRWPAVHKLDAARLFCLALEHGKAGSAYHAVSEEGIAFRLIAETLATELSIPAVSKSPSDAAKSFGFLSPFVAVDNPVSSRFTQDRLNWRPAYPDTFSDLPGAYFSRNSATSKLGSSRSQEMARRA